MKIKKLDDFLKEMYWNDEYDYTYPIMIFIFFLLGMLLFCTVLTMIHHSTMKTEFIKNCYNTSLEIPEVNRFQFCEKKYEYFKWKIDATIVKGIWNEIHT